MAFDDTSAVDAYLAELDAPSGVSGDDRGIIAKSLARGTDNLQATLWGAGAMAADALGAMGVSDWMLGKYVANTKEAALSPAEVATWKDVDGIAKGATYALEAIFENVPTMIPAMVTGGGAALLATAGRKALAAGVGAYAANWAQLSGGIYGDIAERTGKRDPLTSAVGGASAAAFETAADMIGIAKFIPRSEKKALAGVIGAGIAGEVQRRMVSRMGIGALKQAGVESVTEAIQTAIEEAAVSHADPTVPFWTSQTMDQITEAAIKAAFAGAAFGGVAGVVPQERADQAAETKPALDAANEMLRKAEDLREQGAPQTAAAMEILTEEMVKDVAEPTVEPQKTDETGTAVAPEGETPVDQAVRQSKAAVSGLTEAIVPEGETPVDQALAAQLPAQPAVAPKGGVQNEAEEKGQESLSLTEPTTPVVTAPGGMASKNPWEMRIDEISQEDWEIASENTADDLDSFHPARSTGYRDYDLIDAAQNFFNEARKTQGSKTVWDAWKSFKEEYQGPQSHLTKIQSALVNLGYKPVKAASKPKKLSTTKTKDHPSTAPGGESHYITRVRVYQEPAFDSEGRKIGFENVPREESFKVTILKETGKYLFFKDGRQIAKSTIQSNISESSMFERAAMSPDEYLKKFHGEIPNHNWRGDKLSEEAIESGVNRSHLRSIGIAITSRKPISAAAVETYDIKLPDGWTREGDLYVPPKAVTAPGTPAPAPAAEAVVESANPYDTAVTGQRLTELRANKPKAAKKGSKLRKAKASDWQNPDLYPGEDYAAPPNSIVIQVRGLDTRPVGDGKPIVLPFDGDLRNAGSTIASGIKKVIGDRNGSFRESSIFATDSKGGKLVVFTYNPMDGSVKAVRFEELKRWREQFSESLGKNPVQSQFAPPRGAPAAPAVAEEKIATHLDEVSKTEGKRSAKEIKSELVSRLEDALKGASEDPFTLDKVVIEIPGDGRFTVFNSKKAIGDILSRAKRLSVSEAQVPASVRTKPKSLDQLIDDIKVDIAKLKLVKGKGRDSSAIAALENQLSWIRRQKDSPTQQPDPIEAALTKAIEATDQRGEVNDFVKGISYAAANAILRIARALYRGGKTIVQAVKEAIAQWRRDNPEAQFDEAELEGKLGQMLEVEAAEPPTPPPPPGTGSTGEPLSDRPFQTPIGRKDQTFLTTAIEWLNDPQVPVRRTGNDERITAMTRIVESFEDDHVAALQYLAAPPAEHRITPDLQIIGTIIVADRSKGAEFAATDPKEKQRLGEIALQAAVQSKLAGNAMGAALQAMTNAETILGGGFYAAEYERFIREHQKTALTDEGAGRLADAVNRDTRSSRDRFLEDLAEIDPRLAAAVANATPTPAWTPDVEKRVKALLAKVGYRELYADKSGKRLAKLLEQLIAEPEPKAETGTVDRLYQDMVAELSRLMRQALDLKKDAQPKDIRARLLRVMGEQQSRLNVLAKIDQLVQDTKNEALIETWESMALPEMQKPASRATLRALLAEETWPDDWNAVFDSRTDGPVVEAIVDSVMAKLEARKTSPVDLSPLRPLILAEANRIRDFHFQRWNQRVSDISLDRNGRLAAIVNRLRKDGVFLSWRQIMESSDITKTGIARQIFEQLTREGHLSRADRLDLANELAKAFSNVLQDARTKNIQRTIEQLTATKTVKDAVKAELPELIRLANAGVLNYASARNAIAKKLNLPQFSSDTARRIYEAAQAAQRKPPGAQRATALRKVLNMIPEESGVPMTEILKAAWYGGILSGIATQARNFSGSFLNLMHEFTALSLRSPKDIPRMFGALIEGLRDSAANEFPAVMRGAEPARLNLDVRTASSAAEQLAKAQQGWKRMLGNYRYVQRFMQAVDSLWYDASSEVMATFQAAQEARRNPTSEDIDARIDKALKRTKADWQRAMAQADEEIAQGLTDPKEQKRRAIEILRQSRPLDIQESSDAFARYVTLNNDPDGFLGIVYHSMVKLRDQYPILTPVIPFLRISANVTNMLLRNSPAGLYRLVTMRPDAIYLPIVGDKLRHADRRLTMEEWQQLRARIVVSSMTMMGMVVMNAIYGDEEDPPFQITGSFDAVPRAKRHQLAEQGIKPYQIRINGVGIDYRLTPGALMLTAVGNWADRERYSTTEDPDYMTKLEASLSAGHGVIFDQSFLSGLAGFMNRPLSNESAGFVSKVSDFGARTLGGFIPTIAKEIDTWVEPTVQQSKGFKEGLQKQIPVARWHIGRPILNALGEEVERPRYPWSWLVSTQTQDPVWDALREKASAGVFLPVVSRAAKVNGKPMDDAQFLRYQRIAGKALRRRLEADLPRFRQMTAKQAKEYLEKAGAATREQARAQIR